MAIWEWEGWVRLTAPDDWTVDEEDNLVTLVDEENGVGALQFSVATYGTPRADVERDGIDTLTKLAANLDGEVELLRAWRPDGTDGAVAAYTAFVSEDDFWEGWFVADGRQQMLLTYNCGLEDRGKERDQYGAILQSAEFLWLGGQRLLTYPWYWLETDGA